jgi:hypothetical protein
MLLVPFILFIWFESDIIITLINIFKLYKKLFIEEYKKERLEIFEKLHYLDFLHVRKANFFTKLISCPICLCFWLTFIQSLLRYDSLKLCIFMFGFNYFINLIVYLLVKKFYDNK